VLISRRGHIGCGGKGSCGWIIKFRARDRSIIAGTSGDQDSSVSKEGCRVKTPRPGKICGRMERARRLCERAYCIEPKYPADSSRAHTGSLRH
jgi:hypothetical protein